LYIIDSFNFEGNQRELSDASMKRKKSSTSSSQAKDRSGHRDPEYRACPLCGSRKIALGTEQLTVDRRGRQVSVQVERWACPNCGERFLTGESRRRLDIAAGLVPARKSA
jgi:YgiT-type zinc finger domain-containing protein